MKVLKQLSIVLVLFLTSCNVQLQPPVYKDFVIQSFNEIPGDSIELKAAIVVNNPNGFSVSALDANAGFLIDNAPSGRIWLDSATTLLASTDTHLPVTARIHSQQLMQNALKLVLNNSLSYRVAGTALAGKGFIKRTFPIQFEGSFTRQDLQPLLRF